MYQVLVDVRRPFHHAFLLRCILVERTAYLMMDVLCFAYELTVEQRCHLS
jgi:hypothetical protein